MLAREELQLAPSPMSTISKFRSSEPFFESGSACKKGLGGTVPHPSEEFDGVDNHLAAPKWKIHAGYARAGGSPLHYPSFDVQNPRAAAHSAYGVVPWQQPGSEPYNASPKFSHKGLNCCREMA